MKKLWSISTTVRNPERVRNFLIALQDFNGKIWNKETQKAFQANLIRYRFYGFGSTQFYNGLTREQIDKVRNVSYQLSFKEAKEIFDSKNYEDSAMRGRTSFKPLEKMGVAFIVDGRVKITSLGEYLLREDYDLGDFFFKSFLKSQYPNPESRDFSDPNIYNIKPFIATMHLISEVNQICTQQGIKVKGISRDEFMIFGQSLLHYKNIKAQAEKIVDFRAKLESMQDKNAKNEYIEKYTKDFLDDFENATGGNLRDYADNTIRYFRLTRYITIRGGGFYIDLEPRRAIEIQKLLEADNGSALEFERKAYIDYMSNIALPVLPWESQGELLKIYDSAMQDVRSLERELGIIQKSFEPAQLSNIADLKTQIEDLRSYRHQLQNMALRRKTSQIEAIDEAIAALIDIRKHDIKASIALEKYITVALNIINDAKEIKPNSILSDDNDFIFTAPANKPDIECFYEAFDSICEVTMLTNRDQWFNEGQPVMRHLRDFENRIDGRDGYCIFVAPSIHRDTVNTFWFSIKYEYEGQKQKIIPLTIKQIIEILEIIKNGKTKDKVLSHVQFRAFLDGIVGLREVVANSEEWLRKIPSKLEEFKDSICG